MIKGAIVIGGVAIAASQRHEAEDDAAGIANDASALTAGAPPGGAPTGAPAWVWPLPTWRGFPAVISDGLGSPRDGGKRQHHGADLDYRAPSKDALPEFVRGTAARSSGGMFFTPEGIPVLAAADGVIWSASVSPRGGQIVISHGAPFATYYQHLAFLRVPMVSRGTGAIRVRAGEPIGIMGNGSELGSASAKGFRHVHFEIWRVGGPAAFVGPAPYLRTARRVAWSSELAARARSKIA